MSKRSSRQSRSGTGRSGKDLLAPRRTMQGQPAEITSALVDFGRVNDALAKELRAAELAGLSAPGAGVDAHRHRVLIERSPAGELRVVKRLHPFRWAGAEA